MTKSNRINTVYNSFISAYNHAIKDVCNGQPIDKKRFADLIENMYTVLGFTNIDEVVKEAMSTLESLQEKINELSEDSDSENLIDDDNNTTHTEDGSTAPNPPSAPNPVATPTTTRRSTKVKE